MPEIPIDTSKFGHFGWEKILEEYTGRRLTKPEDRLAAFGGIARWFLENCWRTGRYLAGLWENDLYRDILWKPGLILNGDPAVKEVYPESTVGVFPTWSWASILGRVDFFRELADILYPTEDGCEVLFGETTISDESMTARKVQGSLTLRGRLQQLDPWP